MTFAMNEALKVLCVGAGHMGTSHARAYQRISGFKIVGIVTRSPESRRKLNLELERLGFEDVGMWPEVLRSLNQAHQKGFLMRGYAEFDDFEKALHETKPDVVSISTYPDSHARYALAALEAGAHLFIEKPLAESVAEAEAIVTKAKAANRKVVVGYILRHHPSWVKFIQVAQTLGKPLIMRMNLNQQSSGANWETHKSLISSTSPIVDCGVHYVDVMCQMTQSKPLRVSGLGARLSYEIPARKINYGHLQVAFEDGSVGWYEAGWGPMMSETAFFIKDVIGPLGCVSIVAKKASGEGASADVDSHTRTESLRVHYSKLVDGKFAKQDEWIDMEDEPDHDELCYREQIYLLNAIRKNLDLTDHLNDAIHSMRIVAAADESYQTGRTIIL